MTATSAAKYGRNSREFTVGRFVSGVAAVVVAIATLSFTGPPAVAASQPLPKVDVTKPCVGVVSFTAAQQRELVRLSDPRTLTGLADGRERMEQITDLLVARNDRRGIFAVFYRNILREAVPALADSSAYDDAVWVNRVSEEFFVRYLAALHASVSGSTIPSPWRTYYRQAADCKVRPGRVAMAGLDAHLILDFPASIAAAKTTKANFDDYYSIGELLQAVTQEIGTELQTTYGADLTEFFHLWAFGDKLDAVAGRGVTTTLLFQGIRTVAFAYGLGLRDPWKVLPTSIAMHGTYGAAETASDLLAAVKLI